MHIGNAVATAQSYDGVLRPTVRVHYFTPGTSNAVWSYGFNAASQLSSVARDNDAFAWTNHYAIERPYTTNGLNQYSAAGGAAFGYDLNGNLTSDPKRAFVYDIENRLVSATPLPGSDVVAAALVYDPLGRLFEVSSPVTGTRRFLYDGDALVAEYDGANQIAKRHVHWPGADLPMVTYQGEGLARSASSSPTTRARSSPSPTPAAPRSRSTATTNMAYPGRAMTGRSNIPGRCGSANWACTTTRPGSTRRRWGGSCRPIPSAIRIRSIFMLMSGMIRPTVPIQAASNRAYLLRAETFP